MKNASQLIAQSVCRPATPSRATCYAQMLVTSHGGAPVHPRLARPSRLVAARVSTDARAATARDAGPAAAPQPQPGTPAYMQQAYDLSYLSRYGGVGDTVAIVDAYDNPTAEADLAAYRAQFRLPPCTSQNGCFRKVDQGGGQSFPSQAPGWAAESALDLDAVSALCPNCHIVLVEANGPRSLDLSTAQAQAAALGANQITDSWGDPFTVPLSGSYTFPGIATVAAAGDQGYLGLINNQYPAALPDVTAAGGTALIPASASGNATARGFTEQAWSNAGSGCDLLSPKPSWQADGGCPGRTYRDLSANASPQSGLAVYDSGAGGWLVMGGTSESAPLIAAYYAITGASAATPASAYAHRSLLNAPVGGSNGTCQISIAYICVVGGGYSGPTGVGSISGAVAPGAPGIGGPGPSGDYTESVGATSAQVQAGVYPNGSDTAYVWQYGTTSAYGQTTAPADAGSGQAPLAVSGTLTGLLPGATYHYRLATSNALGTTYGYDSTFKATGSAATTLTAVKVSGPRSAKVRGIVAVANGSTSYRLCRFQHPAARRSEENCTTAAGSPERTILGRRRRPFSVARSAARIRSRCSDRHYLDDGGPRRLDARWDVPEASAMPNGAILDEKAKSRSRVAPIGPKDDDFPVLSSSQAHVEVFAERVTANRRKVASLANGQRDPVCEAASGPSVVSDVDLDARVRILPLGADREAEARTHARQARGDPVRRCGPAR